MPRSRYQFTEEDVPVVHRWVHAKLRDIAWPQHEAARTAWEQFPRAADRDAAIDVQVCFWKSRRPVSVADHFLRNSTQTVVVKRVGDS